MSCSLEFFPPKSEAARTALLEQTLPALAPLQPEYCSVTYGAGGSTREPRVQTVLDLQGAGFTVAPHLSFGQDDETVVADLLERYQRAGITRLVALRGDVPSGMGGSGQLVRAQTLVKFPRETLGDQFHISVAAYPEIHPQAPGYAEDVAFLKAKLDAGADAAITQFFYNVDAYFYFLDRCLAAGINQPIHPGIMPLTNLTNLTRFADGCGAEIPRWIRQRAGDFRDDPDGLRQFGIDVTTQLCATLEESGAPPVHFYTMNRAKPTLAVAANLNWLSDS